MADYHFEYGAAIVTTDAGRSYGGVSAVDRRLARKAELIRAAIRVYGARGYRQATVNAVCREAGLTPRYFYETFENSEALLAAAFEAVTEAVIADVAAAGGRVDGSMEGAPVARMRAMLGAYYELLRREPAAARVFLIEITGVNPAIDALFARSLETFADLVIDTLVVDHPTQRRLGRNGSTALLRAGAIYGLMHVARSWIVGGYRQTIEEVVDAAMPLCTMLAHAAAGTER